MAAPQTPFLRKPNIFVFPNFCSASLAELGWLLLVLCLSDILYLIPQGCALLSLSESNPVPPLCPQQNLPQLPPAAEPPTTAKPSLGALLLSRVTESGKGWVRRDLKAPPVLWAGTPFPLPSRRSLLLRCEVPGLCSNSHSRWDAIPFPMFSLCEEPRANPSAGNGSRS